MTTPVKYTIRGAVMHALSQYEHLLGYHIWEKHVAPMVGADPKDWKGRPYRDFKAVMADLQNLKYVYSVLPASTKGRDTIAKRVFDMTAEGEEWWERIGQMGERVESSTTLELPPMKKWMNLSDVNAATRKHIEKKVFSGEWLVAMRPAEED